MAAEKINVSSEEAVNTTEIIQNYCVVTKRPPIGMKPGDVFINPYVKSHIDGKPNPMYKLVYVSRTSYCNVKCLDFHWKNHEMYMLSGDEEAWKVVGHINLFDIVKDME